MGNDGFDDFRAYQGKPGEIRYLPLTFVDGVGWVSKDYPGAPHLRVIVAPRYSKSLTTPDAISKAKEATKWVADERVEHRHWTYTGRSGIRHVHEMRTDRLKIELYVSPTGRSQRVFINGKEAQWKQEADSDGKVQKKG